MKINVTVAKSTQSAVPELNMKEKTLYYLVIGEGETAVKLNVGEKTYNSIKDLTDEKSKKSQTTGAGK